MVSVAVHVGVIHFPLFHLRMVHGALAGPGRLDGELDRHLARALPPVECPTFAPRSAQDIMENFQRGDAQSSTIYSTAHSQKHSWGTNTALDGGNSAPIDLGEFHTVLLGWSEASLSFFVDGELTWSLQRPDEPSNYDWRAAATASAEPHRRALAAFASRLAPSRRWQAV